MNDRTSAEGLSANRLCLGALTLDLRAGELLAADGRPAALRRQALEVLLALGERAGQVVTKDELMGRVWPDVVVGDGSLAQAITDIRRVLGDGGHERVRNVARRGYMLVPDEAEPARPKPELPLLEDTAPVSAQASGRSRFVSRALLVLGALAVLAGAAWWLRPRASAETVPTLVVLPLRAIGDDAGSRTIADGLSEELIGSLAHIEGLRVIARTSTTLAASESGEPARLIERLGISHLLEGSLQRSGEHLRVRLRLVEARGGGALWARDFDREAPEVLLLQREIAESVASSLALRLGLAGAPIARSGDVEFLRRFRAAQTLGLHQPGPVEETVEPAEGELRALLRERPDDARVHSALGLVLVVHAARRPTLRDSLLSEARHEAALAQRLDPSLPDPYWIDAQQACSRNDWESCLNQMQLARERGAEIAGRVASDREIVLARLGYLDRAEASVRELILRDPLHSGLHFLLARLLDTQGRHEQARLAFERAAPTANYGRWFNAVWRGDRVETARIVAAGMVPTDAYAAKLQPCYEEVTRALADPGHWPAARAAVRKFEQQTGLFGLLRVLEPDAPAHPAELIAGLNSMRQRGYSTWDLLLWTEDLAWLRRSPEFQVYLRDNGILAYWRAHGFPPQCRPQGEAAACR